MGGLQSFPRSGPLESIARTFADPTQTTLVVSVEQFETLDRHRDAFFDLLFPPKITANTGTLTDANPSPTSATSATSATSSSSSSSTTTTTTTQSVNELNVSSMRPHIDRLVFAGDAHSPSSTLSLPFMTALFTYLTPTHPQYRPSSSILTALSFNCIDFTSSLPKFLLLLQEFSSSSSLKVLEFVGCFSTLYGPIEAKRKHWGEDMNEEVAKSLQYFLLHNHSLVSFNLQYAGLTNNTFAILYEGLKNHRPPLTFLELSHNPRLSEKGSEAIPLLMELWDKGYQIHHTEVTLNNISGNTSSSSSSSSPSFPSSSSTTTVTNARGTSCYMYLFADDTGSHSRYESRLWSILFDNWQLDDPSSTVRGVLEKVSRRIHNTTLLEYDVSLRLSSRYVKQLLVSQQIDELPGLLEGLGEIVLGYLDTTEPPLILQ